MATRLLNPSVDRARLERVVLWTLVVALLLPLAVIALRALAHGDLNPGGDRALIELRVRDVGSHTPLLGSYGRYGFNQPGPLWFFLLALPYRLLGSHYSGLQVAVLAVSALAIVQILFISRRRGGLVPLLWTGLLLAVLIHGLGPWWIADPWEPRGLTLVCVALIFLAFDAALGRLAALPVAAVAATLLAQAQAGLVAFAVAMFVIAAAGVVVRVLRDRDDARLRASATRTMLLTGGLLLVLWLPPLVALARHDAGNLADMWRSLRSPAETLGYGDASRTVAQQLGSRAPWLGFDEVLRPFDITLDVHNGLLFAVALPLLVVSIVFAWRRREQAAVLGGVVFVAILAAVAGLGRLLGPLYFWIPEWTRALGMTSWAAIGWCGYRALDEPVCGRIDRVALPVLTVAFAAVTIMGLSDAVRTPTTTDPTAAAAHQLAAEVLPSVQAAHGATLVTASADQSKTFGAPINLPTLVLDLERDHVHTLVDPSVADRFGSERAQPQRAVMELRIITDTDPVPAGFTLLATADPLTPDQRAERQRLIGLLPGVQPNASGAELLQYFVAHPESRAVGDRLGQIPALPVLSVVGRPLPH